MSIDAKPPNFNPHIHTLTMTTSLPIRGTVYGVLLNAQAEWHSVQTLMNDAPYKAAPIAPVLYVKTANTWTACDSVIAVPSDVPEVEVGATLGVVIGAHGKAKAYVLLNDVSVPHTVAQQGFYRPPVKYKNLDGFLGVGAQAVNADAIGNPNALHLEVRINGVLQQTVDLSAMRRHAAALIDEVNAFMTLHDNDVLMLGLDICTQGDHAGQRPLAHVGDVIEISAPQAPALGVMRHTLVSAPALEMAA